MAVLALVPVCILKEVTTCRLNSVTKSTLTITLEIIKTEFLTKVTFTCSKEKMKCKILTKNNNMTITFLHGIWGGSPVARSLKSQDLNIFWFDWDIFSSTTDLYLKSLCFNYQYLQERCKNIVKHEVIDSFHLCWISQLLSVLKSFMQLITRFH